MVLIENFQDLCTRYNGHSKYRNTKIIEDELVEVLVQKLEMILFTNQGEVFGQESVEFGANLEYYLWETTVSNDILKGIITQQINKYIPELNIIGYSVDLKLFEGTVQDILEINFTIQGQNVIFILQ